MVVPWTQVIAAIAKTAAHSFVVTVQEQTTASALIASRTLRIATEKRALSAPYIRLSFGIFSAVSLRFVCIFFLLVVVLCKFSIPTV